MMSLWRDLEAAVEDRLQYSPCVALLGPRQSGKTTLAQDIGEAHDGIYLDLENPDDVEKLENPNLFFAQHETGLIILDEVQRMPGLFQVLRGVVDRDRRKGRRSGRFLLLGSASRELLQQSETLAGRIAYLELGPLNVLETEPADLQKLWVRGGFPESFLAENDNASFRWRQDFVQTYLERDIPQYGPRIPAATLRRFWTMLAHTQGAVFNASSIARGLDMEAKSANRYLDLMVDLMLMRRLPPYFKNVGKRLVKSPKVYVRDSGVTHALLGLPNMDALLGHPVVGFSWEGFAIDNLLAALPELATAYFYRTQVGAEIDLLLEIPGHGLWAIEVKLGHSSRPRKGFYIACDDVEPDRRFLVNSGTERRDIGQGIELIGLAELCSMVGALRQPKTVVKAKKKRGAV
ncbi:ATPase [Bryobacterales bacterium F-183]|nr:ATPase [Bryobacterales bacterium F-183]